MISILIITLNEELNLSTCLQAVSWSDDIVVFDSFSTDKTVEIAKAAGARIIQRKFDNFSAQRNAALKVDFKYPWVLMVDADEVIPEDLRVEIAKRLEEVSADVDMFRMRRKDMFLGRWLKRSGGYPTWFPRLFRVGRVWVERDVNEQMLCKGTVLSLNAHFIHYPFNNGVAFWFERHNRYSTMEALALVNKTHGKMCWTELFAGDPVVRRKGLKQLLYRLPCRPLLVFFYLYVVRMGFLDGVSGWHYARMRAIYEYMINLKMVEFYRRKNNLQV